MKDTIKILFNFLIFSLVFTSLAYGDISFDVVKVHSLKVNSEKGFVAIGVSHGAATYNKCDNDTTVGFFLNSPGAYAMLSVALTAYNEGKNLTIQTTERCIIDNDFAEIKEIYLY